MIGVRERFAGDGLDGGGELSSMSRGVGGSDFFRAPVLSDGEPVRLLRL